jgi:hypothetical protein
MSRDYHQTLEIDGPTATCGGCRFTSALEGAWSVEDGRLVWRAEPDPQPGRGPDLTSCCEGSDCADEFRHVTVDGGDLSAGDLAALRATAADARLHEFDEPQP